MSGLPEPIRAAWLRRPVLRPMRDRNQALVAVVGTVLALVVVLASINLDSLPFVNRQTDYHAQFENADGLKSGDDVRVAGVSVGSVDSVRVDGGHVDVAFTVRSGLALGGSSRASIEVATVLGNLFLQVESAGAGRLAGGGTIPLSRTTTAYSLLGAFNQLGEFTDGTDIPTLQASLRTLASTVGGISPAEVRSALTGLTSISTTLAAKQDDIAGILSAANAVVGTLNSNSGALTGLLANGEEFLRQVVARHDLIAQLLRDTANLGTQLREMFDRNGTQLSALLANLDRVTAVLAKEKDQLQSAVVSLGRFSENITNATGSGPWIDLLTPTALVPDNQIKGCGVNPAANPQKPCSP